jgi:4-hydroxyacetophenone monooxygenase
MDDRPNPGGFDADLMERGIAGAHFQALLMALVHLTGDVSLLTEGRRPRTTDFIAIDGGVPAEEQAEIRQLAREVIGRHLAGTLPPARALTPDELKRMMNFVVGGAVPETCLPFLIEELGVAGADPRRPTWTLPASEAPPLDVVVIGAGMSGLLAAIRLQQAGVPFVVIEKNPEVGGTWFENTYPGCRVDSNNQLYSYSFEPNLEWPQYFSTQPVLLDYFRRVAEKYDLKRHIRFSTTVEEMAFDEAGQHWNLRLRTPDGGTETLSARVAISAVGQLNRPLVPAIPGRETFKGEQFHSAEWRYDVPIEGRRVACIGTGASAFQFVPEIAPVVGELLVFQRNPPWLLPTPEYHDDVPAPERWMLAHVPFYANWYRFWLFYLYVDGFHEFVKCDPAFTGGGHAVSALNEGVRERFAEGIRQQVLDRPDLAPYVIPSYPFGGKRSLRDNGVWLAALKRDNVRLVTAAIERIDETGIVTTDGVHHDVDVIVWGTGFQASRFLWPMRVVGRGGTVLSEKWGADARAYLGITVPGFPNLFCLYGPNTNLVVNGSIIFFSECAVGYTLQALKHMLDHGLGTLEVREEVHDRYNARIDEANAHMAWGVPEVSSWYKSASGRVSQNWPLPTVDYWAMTRYFQPEEYTAEKR